MKHSSKQQHRPELFWPGVVMRKWLNFSTKESDYNADTDSDPGSGSDSDSDSGSGSDQDCDGPRQSRVKDASGSKVEIDEALPRLRRRVSETFRAQYINTKEIRVCVGTWNVGGRVPPDDLDIDGWLDVNEAADIYVIGFQEIIPLNAGNVFGAEDSRPISNWEDIIRETLNKIPPVNKFKSFSDPPSPSRFKPSDDAPDIEEEIVLEFDSGCNKEEIVALNDDSEEVVDVRNGQLSVDDLILPTKILRVTEKIGLSWPERPLDLLGQHILETPSSLKTMKSFKTSKSFKTYSSFKSEAALLAMLDLESLIKRKRRPAYVRIISKQMVGIFLTIWVRRSLRKHIQNVNVSTVGVGVMGFIGNKGSVSVSMSVYQTLFCFVCTHQTSGEKDADAVKRNTDVHEIHRRTHFNSFSGIGLPKIIHDHERIIWLGDLNYRINLSYDKTRSLISEKDWCKLIESDQLSKELKKGRAFDGWSEGTIKFPPTYKYESNSEKYCGEDPRAGRRNPAWCDRILSFGKGMRLLRYRRTELRLSDHRPVSATYMVEVEVFSARKLQRALAFTDAEIEKEEIVTDLGIEWFEPIDIRTGQYNEHMHKPTLRSILENVDN